MTIINPLPDTLTNGTTADATQVMANFNQIVANTNANGAHNGANSDITTLTGLTGITFAGPGSITGITVPLTVAQGGTGATTFTSGAPVVGAGASAMTSGLTTLTNSLSGNVLLNNTANYFDGPSVAQGTTGTWFASGTVTGGSTANDDISIKLWDGTTVIASAVMTVAAGGNTAIAISGYITSPAGNIRISARDPTSTNGLLKFNNSGNSKDCTISVIRIA